jgi:hypothetical protein
LDCRVNLSWKPVGRKKPRHVPLWIFGIKSKLNERHTINTIINKIKYTFFYLGHSKAINKSIFNVRPQSKFSAPSPPPPFTKYSGGAHETK